MQYQVVNKDGVIITWIDTDKGCHIEHDNYLVICGDKLDAVQDENGNLRPIIRQIVRYEKWIITW